MKKWLSWLMVAALALLVACGGDDMADEAMLEAEDTNTAVSEPSAEEEEMEEEEVVEPYDDMSYLDEYAAYIEARTAEDGIPGTAVAVIQGGEVVLVQGFGYRDIANELPATGDTLFHIGSTNKSFTAMLVGTLVDEGTLTWDTPIVEVYPDFPLSEEITFRHLLSMSSGIGEDAEDGFDVDNGTAEDVLTFLSEVEPIAEPEEVFSYSNLASSVAGYTAVIAAGADGNGLYDGYATLLRERILEPVGMNTAVVRASEAEQNPNYGRSYIIGDDGEPEEAEPEDYDGDPLAPSGTLKASATDMALYVATYLNEGVAPNGTRILSAESQAEMVTPVLENYALGWEVSEVDGYEVIAHEGSYDNYLSIIGFVPELELGFVVLANSADAAESLIEEAPATLIGLYDE